MQVVVESLLTNYKDSGKGKGILLLHGWGDTADTFRSLEEGLNSYYRIVSVDLPGFGKTQPPNQAWGLDEYANFIAKFVSKIGLKTHVIIAHSNGGAIAIRGLAKNVLSSDKLVLIASSGIRNQYRGFIKSLRLITKAGKFLTKPLPMAIKMKLRGMVYRTVGSDMLVAEHLQESFKKIVTDDVQPDAAKITIPTLLIYGSKDKATPISYGERFHELIKNSDLKKIDQAGHFVHQDQAELVIGYIDELLR